MATKEQREQFDLYKKDVTRRGKSFYPFAMFHDTVMSVVVVAVIIGLACIWYFTTSSQPNDAGILGPRYTNEADPGTTSFVPRPDWYFYFLFYLLRIFKWPDSVILGTVGLPTIALILLLMVPFYDRRRERRLGRRPVAVIAAALVIASMGMLTYKVATAKESLPAENIKLVPQWITKEHLPPGGARDGARLFAEVGCMNCHTYLGAGSSNLGAPDLTAIGTNGKTVQFYIEHTRCPQCTTPGSQMQPFPNLTKTQLRDLALFLVNSKGAKS